METFHLSERAQVLLDNAYQLAENMGHEYVTPEHLLLSSLDNKDIYRALKKMADESAINELEDKLDIYLESLETTEDFETNNIGFSFQMVEVMEQSINNILSASCSIIDIPHIFNSLLQLKESEAAYNLNKILGGRDGEFISVLLNETQKKTEREEGRRSKTEGETSPGEEAGDDKAEWRQYVECLNDTEQDHNPLIGREDELEETIRTLCRKDKNNPMHIGDPGVGKTALVYGLARLINEGRVPQRLKESKIYSMDVGNLVAGTQFRGDFESRIKEIMKGVEKEPNAIVYIDEIHSIIGAGATGSGVLDASNMLKPYLEGGKIRFIGSTTHEEYKRHILKNKGFVRRFRNIEINEPSVEETIGILRQLQPNYERYHHVKYETEAIEYAVKSTAKYLTDRRLPDKAIDLMDEAGAYRRIHPADSEIQCVDKSVMEMILSKICNIDRINSKENEEETLMSLQDRLLSQVYGQDEAIRNVTEAVLMAKSGLTDENKPLASLLFVGPTGVGKTEIAKVLAAELGVELVRFDMSEFSEKHSVAKLIGSPAGYVGYEDGGLLTDAVRRHPDCVLLLDEIEKAHSDIYNILLQVMDYARLTDNRGNQSDFRNTIIIMTSNAGAQYASQANVGFGSQIRAGESMMKQVKKTFKPEFINRLSGIVVFNDMDHQMATLILDKKLRELQKNLNSKGVTLEINDEAKEFILRKGITKEYGAREIERVVNQLLKPILMREILFGILKTGGKAIITYDNDKLKLEK
ncbi:MAG: AAA domain-containing protein [Bacteroides sp.]|nr:AAA domain-containing protein [Bacteroides sp.]